MTIRVAGAPVSFGVFELTPAESEAFLPGPDAILGTLADAGYRGVDLGPVGFLGRGAELRRRLSAFDLPLAGGWIDLPFSDRAAFDDSLGRLDDALDAFEEARGVGDGALAALPTLADSGNSIRKAHPGGGAGLSLDDTAWRVLADNVARAATRVRERGFEPTFHHHACTFVETPDEIDRFLSLVDVDLTFDTGHLLLGGGDPSAAWSDWGERINHVHLKDVDLAVLHGITARGGSLIDVWTGGSFVPLGQGDLDIRGILDSILGCGYTGWIVVEQDVLRSAHDDPSEIAANQVLNRNVLREWIP